MTKRHKKARADNCVIPDTVQPEAMEKYLLKQSPFDGSEEIRSYVEWQSPKEQVTYLERISTERVLGVDHDIWDVHTSGERYWVITEPTNLYSQRLFPSADYTLSFHIGLAARIAARREARATEDEQERVPSAWRRWSQAGMALDTADEAEDFQAIGMRCRECLIDFTRSVADDSMVPPLVERPKTADFIHWAELIAGALAGGSSAKEVRGYLRDIAKSTWQLVNWLTHASNASRFDAELALEATHSTLVAYTAALLRFERGVPRRCPQCSSYQITSRYVSDPGETPAYASLCESCGWNNALAGSGESAS